MITGHLPGLKPCWKLAIGQVDDKECMATPDYIDPSVYTPWAKLRISSLGAVFNTAWVICTFNDPRDTLIGPRHPWFRMLHPLLSSTREIRLHGPHCCIYSQHPIAGLVPTAA